MCAKFSAWLRSAAVTAGAGGGAGTGAGAGTAAAGARSNTLTLNPTMGSPPDTSFSFDGRGGFCKPQLGNERRGHMGGHAEGDHCERLGFWLCLNEARAAPRTGTTP